MKSFKIILAVLLSLVAAGLLVMTALVLMDPIRLENRQPTTLQTDAIFVPQEPEELPEEVVPEEEEAPEEEAPAEEPPAEEVPVEEVPEEVKKASSYLSGMTEEEKLWQLFLVTPENLTGVGLATRAGEATKEALEKKPVGGLCYFAANLEDREQVVELLSNTQSYAKTPLFLGLDEEGGAVSRAGSNEALGVTKFEAAAEYGKRADMAEVYQVGETMAKELTALGFNLNFAPVADVLVEPENTEIGSRAYSSDPSVTSAMVAAMVQGLQQGGMASCLKHFPGHGSTLTDSHEGTAVSQRTVEELRQVEWEPFRSGIEKGVSLVMLSHLTNPNLSEKPASLSAEVVGMLREELGFGGVIITDSMQMGAITEHYDSGEAAVLALEAGADMIMIPADLQAAYDGVKQALTDGRLTWEAVDQHVLRILTAKYQMGIMA